MLFKRLQKTLGKDVSLMVAFLVSLIPLLLLLIMGKYLWNEVLVQVVTVVRPVTCVWQILGLYVLLGLIL